VVDALIAGGKALCVLWAIGLILLGGWCILINRRPWPT
jgi:hypothetical protein